MSHCHGRWAALSALVLAICGVVFAEPGDDFKLEPGYTALFNGKDLTGWRYGKAGPALDGKTESADKRFFVKDGIIVADEGKGIKDLWTVKEFDKDFNLKLEFRAGEKSDSGVYLRGPQLQVRDFIRRGEQKQLKKFKNDDWNELDITVRGGAIVTALNGKAVTPRDVLEVTVKDGKPVAKLNGAAVDVAKLEISVNSVATSLCNGEPLSPPTMNVPAKGPIGLQSEPGAKVGTMKFEFRRIRIKELN